MRMRTAGALFATTLGAEAPPITVATTSKASEAVCKKTEVKVKSEGAALKWQILGGTGDAFFAFPVSTAV